MLTFRQPSSRFCIFLAQTRRPHSYTSSSPWPFQFKKTSQLEYTWIWNERTNQSLMNTSQSWRLFCYHAFWERITNRVISRVTTTVSMEVAKFELNKDNKEHHLIEERNPSRKTFCRKEKKLFNFAIEVKEIY